jgi:hypothetical protein
MSSRRIAAPECGALEEAALKASSLAGRDRPRADELAAMILGPRLIAAHVVGGDREGENRPPIKAPDLGFRGESTIRHREAELKHGESTIRHSYPISRRAPP